MPTPTPLLSHSSIVTRDAVAASSRLENRGLQELFVVNSDNNTVTSYNLNGTQTTLSISEGLHHPRGIAVDSRGKIYVSNLADQSGYGDITTYSKTGAQERHSITQNIAYPLSVAFGPNRDLYVGNTGLGSEGGFVIAFSARGTYLISFGFGADYPSGVAVDRSGTVYVTDESVGVSYSGAVFTYTAEGASGDLFITSEIDIPTGVVVSPAGEIFVTNSPLHGKGYVSSYSSDGVVAGPEITDGIDHPCGIAMDDTGKVYVSNGNNTITTYANGSRIAPTIKTGLSSPCGIAVH